MKRLIAVSGACLWAWLPLSAAAANDPTGLDRMQVGKVERVVGTAIAAHETTERALAAADALYFQDLIRTGDKARLSATLADGTDITLGAQASLLIDEFVYDPGASKRTLTLRSIAGAFVVAVDELKGLIDDKVALRTPVGVIDIDGAQVWGGLIDDAYGILALEGTAAVTTPAGMVALQQGEGISIEDPAVPATVKTWPDDKVRRAFATVNMPADIEGASPPAEGSLLASLLGGKISLDARYRFELVDDDAFSRAALAHSLRTRLGYETAPFHGVSALVELENIAAIGRKRFNDTVDQRRDFPVVADPEGTEINRLWLAYQARPLPAVKIGRQRILFDNQRFVGNVGFRQNEQTFDAIRVSAKPLPTLSADYAYVFQVNRIFGSDSAQGELDSDSHLVRLAYALSGIGSLIGYGYLLDFDRAPALSSATYGLRLVGSQPLGGRWDLVYALEHARQWPHGRNRADGQFAYYLIEPGIARGSLALRVGYEQLGGDGGAAFQAPIGTLHAFQGAADKFLLTPADGIRDAYLQLDYVVKGWGVADGTTLQVAYHRFWAEQNGTHYGDEIDLDIRRRITGNVSVGVLYAAYAAADFSTDTHKAWVELRLIY